MLKPTILFRVTAPAVVVSLVLLGSSSVVSIFLYQQQAATAQDLGENVDSREAAYLLEGELRGLSTVLHSAEDAKSVPSVLKIDRDVGNGMAEAMRLADKPAEVRAISDAAASFERYTRAWQDALDAPPETSQEKLRVAIDILDKETLPKCVELGRFNSEQVKSSRAEHDANVKRMIWGLPVVAGIGSVAGIVLGYGVARTLRQSLYRLSVRVRDAADKLGQDLPLVTLTEDGDLHGLHEQMTAVVHEVEQVVQRLQQREREVLRAEQLAAVGQVAAGVAHELRNPLTSIKMLVQMNRRQGAAHGLPAENLPIIEQEIRRIERCLQTFLDFARPPVAERRSADLVGIIRKTFALIEGRACKQHVQLELKPACESWIGEVDPDQIHQLLVNLALNALDAMPNGGKLSVELIPDNDGQVQIHVLDTGTGILPQVLPRLFEPFVSSKETGVGLGLVVSRRIAEEHGGNLSACNRPEGGACFTLSLPLSKPANRTRIELATR